MRVLNVGLKMCWWIALLLMGAWLLLCLAGLLDGLTGLSMFWTWYVCSAGLVLGANGLGLIKKCVDAGERVCSVSVRRLTLVILQRANGYNSNNLRGAIHVTSAT